MLLLFVLAAIPACDRHEFGCFIGWAIATEISTQEHSGWNKKNLLSRHVRKHLTMNNVGEA
ncbi:hypothetical protein [Coleofasciculus sp. H7-2]|uniref:hypothetical protein n=1 Tax=Coleofasciculus sp. H7-2 TaxID=3351545 RepID=UPI00366ED4B8